MMLPELMLRLGLIKSISGLAWKLAMLLKLAPPAAGVTVKFSTKFNSVVW
jgi:hypothetical protein